LSSTARRAILTAVAVLAASMTPAFATVGRQQPGIMVSVVTGHVRPLASYVEQGFTPPQAALVRRLDGLAASGVPLASLQPKVRATRGILCQSFLFVFLFSSTPGLQAAGDLDGDGRGDVIESREVPRSKEALAWVVTARSGNTGAVLWTRRTSLAPDHWGVALPAPTGRSGRPGVVMLELGSVFNGPETDGVIDLSDHITGLDGRGRTLWQHADSGRIIWTTDTYVHAPDRLGIAQLRSGATDVLVVTHDTQAGGSSTASLARVSGADGRTTHPIPTVHGDSSLPEIGSVPDQDGNRYDDVVSASFGLDHAVTTYRGDTGAVVWSNAVVPLDVFAWVEDAGRVTGALASERPVHDLVLTSARPVDNASFITPIGLVGESATTTVSLLTGGTGMAAWVKPGGAPYLVGRAGPQHVGAVGIATTTATLVPGTERVTERIDTYDAKGVPVWSGSYSFEHAAGDCGTGTALAFTGIGDLDGDGALEGQVLLIITDGQDYYDSSRTVAGLDGREIDQAWDEGLGGSVDGHGDDRVRYRVDGRGLTVWAERGLDRHLLWTRSLPVPGGAKGAEVLATPVSPGRCQDVGITTAGDSGAVTALLASSGAPRWTVTYRGKADATGRLVTARPPRGLC
jgi:hypothetical protein